MLTARCLDAVSFALGYPSIDALWSYLNQRACLSWCQQFSVRPANRTQRKDRLSDDALALEGYDLDPSFFRRCEAHAIIEHRSMLFAESTVYTAA